MIKFAQKINKKVASYIQLTKTSEVERYGSSYGGWNLPRNHGLNENSICYLAGAGEEVSFDLAIQKQFGCYVRIIDPTPKAVAHLDGLLSAIRLKRSFNINNSEFEYDLDGLDLQKISIHKLGLARETGVQKFFAPKNAGHASYSTLNIQKTSNSIEFECISIQDLMAQQVDYQIDLLKMDIEGAEYEVIKGLLDNRCYPRILLIEFDEIHSPLDRKAKRRVKQAKGDLLSVGYRLLDVENSNFCFFYDGNEKTTDEK
jgi:FkbM family methyltransferase